MQHLELAHLFLQISLLLAVAIASGQLARAARMPAVLGEIVGGVLLGPTLLGTLAPSALERLFPTAGPTRGWREIFLHVGMVFFLLAAGLEVDIGQRPANGRRVALTALLAWAVPLGAGVALVYLWPSLWGAPALARPHLFALFMGTALSITALPVIARILLDLNLMHTETGSLIMTAAALCDLGGWMLFGFVLAAARPDATGLSPSTHVLHMAIFTGLLLVAGRWLGQPLFAWARRRLAWPSGFIGLVALLALMAAAAAEGLGLHAAFGAFLLGVAVSADFRFRGAEQARDVIHEFAISFFAPLYFVSVGLKTDFAAHFDVQLALTVTLVATVAKTGGAWLGARWGGVRGKQAWAVGCGMNGRGAMEIILASVALDAGLIDARIYSALVFMALATAILSAASLRRLLSPAAPRPASTADVDSRLGQLGGS